MRRDTLSPWQSFSDLAMGLMAVFILVLLALLSREQARGEELEQEAERLKREKLELERLRLEVEEQQKALARLFRTLVEDVSTIEKRQNEAEQWLTKLFERPGCRLKLAESGELVLKDGTAGLYKSGETELSKRDRENLASCVESFERMACAIVGDLEMEKVASCAASRCLAINAAAGLGSDDERTRDEEMLRVVGGGLDALVLEGNTDRVNPSRERSIPRTEVAATDDRDSFVRNAHLGAERARQALGFLLEALREPNRVRPPEGSGGACSPVDLLMSRVRVESPSFGRTLAGPKEKRLSKEACDHDRDECAGARNLSLRIRWTKEELRRPIEEYRTRFCKELQEPRSFLRRGLELAGDLEGVLARLRCDQPGAPP